jgi:MFS superfamily sulfate permease-like transporter
MNLKQIGLGVVLVDFVALTGYALYQYGLIGFFETLLSSAAGAAVLADLVIALSLVIVWMWRDARARGWSPLPYAVLTLALGSVGPLVYLMRRVGTPAPQTVHGGLARSAA